VAFTPSPARTASPTPRASCIARVCGGAQAGPDSTMAWPNRPRAEGIAIRLSTEPPPADSPNTVTRAGSPPKAAMLRWTQRNAAIWSICP